MTKYTLAQAQQVGDNGQKQLKEDIDAALAADSIDEGVVQEFKTRYQRLNPIPESNSFQNEGMKTYRKGITDKLVELEAKHPIISASSSSASAFTTVSGSSNQLSTPLPSRERSPVLQKSEQEQLSDEIDEALVADSIEKSAIEALNDRLLALPEIDNEAVVRDRTRISKNIERLGHKILIQEMRQTCSVLSEEINMALDGDSIEDGVIEGFNERHIQLSDLDDEALTATISQITEELSSLKEKFPTITSSSSHTPTPPSSGRVSPVTGSSGQGGEGNGNSGKTTSPPSGNEEALQRALNKAAVQRGITNLLLAAKEKQAADKLAQSLRSSRFKSIFKKASLEKAAKVPLPDSNNEPKDKPLDQAALVAIKTHLHKFEVDLNGNDHDKDSGKLKVAAHKAKVTEMHNLLLTKLEPLFKNNSKANLEQFKEDVAKLLADEKNSFKATPWIWHDVIRPALVGLIGIIVSIVTLPARPFKSSVADYANSFFVKPDSKAQIALKEEADILINEVGKAAAPGA